MCSANRGTCQQLQVLAILKNIRIRGECLKEISSSIPHLQLRLRKFLPLKSCMSMHTLAYFGRINVKGRY